MSVLVYRLFVYFFSYKYPNYPTYFGKLQYNGTVISNHAASIL